MYFAINNILINFYIILYY